MSRAQGQFTIIDYNDALTLTGFIESNHPKTQMYNPDNGTFIPDWVQNYLVLTPNLYVIGSSVNQILSSNVEEVRWYQGTATTPLTTGGPISLSGLYNHILSCNANILQSANAVNFRCEIDYRDPSTGLLLTHPLTITFSKTVNGSGIVDLLVMTPNGNVFKNTEVASLTAKAELWRGSTIDTSSVTYKWAKMDSSVTSSSSSGYDADFGVGWKKLTNTANMYAGCTTATLTIYPDAVDSYAVIKCCAKDTDSSSTTYNTKFYDVATFIDNSDPLQVVISSTGGDVFKNGVGSTTLTAVVYQAGQIIDSSGTGTYTWTKYDKDSAVDTHWGTNGQKTGKTLSVSSSDVDVKATFMVEVVL